MPGGARRVSSTSGVEPTKSSSEGASLLPIRALQGGVAVSERQRLDRGAPDLDPVLEACGRDVSTRPLDVQRNRVDRERAYAEAADELDRMAPVAAAGVDDKV